MKTNDEETDVNELDFSDDGLTFETDPARGRTTVRVDGQVLAVLTEDDQ